MNDFRVNMRHADLFLGSFAESEQPSHPTYSITSYPQIPLATSALLSQPTGTAKDLTPAPRTLTGGSDPSSLNKNLRGLLIECSGIFPVAIVPSSAKGPLPPLIK